MDFQPCMLFTLVLVISNVLNAWSASVSSSIGGNSIIMGGKYTLNTKTIIKDGKPFTQVIMNGNGVDDVFEHELENYPTNLLTTDNVMVYGDPTKNKFVMFSDAPSTLVLIKNGKCTKKTYTTKSGTTSSTSKEMTSNDCTAVKNKIFEEQEKNRIYWEEWNKNFKQQMANAFPPGFPFHNKASNLNHKNNNNYQINDNYNYDYGNNYDSSGSTDYDPSTSGNNWFTNLMRTIFNAGFPFA